ncbi:hypothetical protein DV736_g5790, partial [Chaetothyriales sp. CBS 134916]
MTSSPAELDEKPGTMSTSQSLHTHRGFHFGHAHHHGQRYLTPIVHPKTGKVTHVVPTLEDIEEKSNKLRRLETEADNDYDIVLHGSPEHIDVVRDVHAHHEGQQNQLKDEHPDVFDKFEHLRNELDALNTEIHMLTDHSVALDASFDKFGYSAHLRTKEDSETSTLHGEHASAHKKHLNRSGPPIKFFKRPQARQYFHKGLLWRSPEAGEVASFELFLDLFYVGVIDIVGEKAVEQPDDLSFLHFVIVFSIGWKIWSDMTNVINWFDIDDIFQRLSVIFYLVCLFGYTTNVFYMFEEDKPTYTSAIAFYIAQRVFLGSWYLMVAWLVPMIRGTMVLNAMIIAVAVILWIASIHLHWPKQLALICLGIMVDLFGGVLLIAITRHFRGCTKFGRSLKKYFEFFPAINIEHRVERNNAFVALVFGYSILTILFQSHASFGINAFFGKGILGLLQAFAFNWIYFEIDAYNIHVHAIRRHWLSSLTWITAHLPFIMGYVLAAATLSQLVLAHDCPDANPERLGSNYADLSVEGVSDAMRWFYCGGLGVSLICMGIISLCHIHKKLDGARLLKRPRLVIRLAVSIIIICLPLAHKLTSLDLISITCALTILILCIDLYGNTCQGQPFWTGGLCHKEQKNVTYTATHKMSSRKKDQLIQAMHRGKTPGLSEFLRKDSSMGSMNTSGTSTPNVKDEEWTGGFY